jgi:hypothetical protein
METGFYTLEELKDEDIIQTLSRRDIIITLKHMYKGFRFGFNEDDLIIAAKILIIKCYGDESKILHNTINPRRLYDAITSYLLYIKHGICRYFLLFSSNVDMINKVLDEQFKVDDDIIFYANLYATLETYERKLLTQLSNSDHPYIQILKYPYSYSRYKGAQLRTKLRDYVEVDKTIANMIPNTKYLTGRIKTHLLTHDMFINNKLPDSILTQKNYPYLSVMIKRKYICSYKYIVHYLNKGTIHRIAKLSNIGTRYDLLCVLGWWSTNIGYNCNVIAASYNVEMVRYLIDNMLSREDIVVIIETIIQNKHIINSRRIHWMMRHNLLNNELMRSLSIILNNREGKLLRKCISIVDA